MSTPSTTNAYKHETLPELSVEWLLIEVVLCAVCVRVLPLICFSRLTRVIRWVCDRRKSIREYRADCEKLTELETKLRGISASNRFVEYARLNRQITALKSRINEQTPKRSVQAVAIRFAATIVIRITQSTMISYYVYSRLYAPGPAYAHVHTHRVVLMDRMRKQEQQQQMGGVITSAVLDWAPSWLLACDWLFEPPLWALLSLWMCVAYALVGFLFNLFRREFDV